MARRLPAAAVPFAADGDGALADAVWAAVDASPRDWASGPEKIRPPRSPVIAGGHQDVRGHVKRSRTIVSASTSDMTTRHPSLR